MGYNISQFLIAQVTGIRTVPWLKLPTSDADSCRAAPDLKTIYVAQLVSTQVFKVIGMGRQGWKDPPLPCFLVPLYVKHHVLPSWAVHTGILAWQAGN